MRFLPFAGGQAGHHQPGSDRFRIALVYSTPALWNHRVGHGGVSGFCLIVSGRGLPICGGIRWRFCFLHRGIYSPARKAGMTGVHLRMSQAGNAGIQSFPLFCLPKRLKGFEDKSTKERSSDMKYHAVWKPGGRPRRGMGSMKPGRRQLQALKPRGTIPGKGAVNCGGIAGKAA